MGGHGKTRVRFYFLVEGETEKWYLQWLCGKISEASPAYFADFRIGTRMSPHAYAKRMHPPEGSRVYTLLDYESTDPSHERRFAQQLHEMRNAGSRSGLDFMLGYTNYAFELWILLHRVLFTRPVYHRKDYLKPINQAFNTSFRSMPNYKKEKNFRQLLATLSVADVLSAVGRAEQIRLRNEMLGRTLLRFEGYQYYRHDPSLSVDLVIRDILQRMALEDS